MKSIWGWVMEIFKKDDTAIEQLKEDAANFLAFSKTKEGKKVLEILKSEFPTDPNIINKPGEGETKFHLGCATPIYFIDQMIRLAEGENNG